VAAMPIASQTRIKKKILRTTCTGIQGTRHQQQQHSVLLWDPCTASSHASEGSPCGLRCAGHVALHPL
jgi:hypothetical protein